MHTKQKYLFYLLPVIITFLLLVISTNINRYDYVLRSMIGIIEILGVLVIFPAYNVLVTLLAFQKKTFGIEYLFYTISTLLYAFSIVIFNIIYLGFDTFVYEFQRNSNTNEAIIVFFHVFIPVCSAIVFLIVQFIRIKLIPLWKKQPPTTR